ncbi:MAG TPA: methylmalonyl-CoA mutase [Chloroflexi bacterium]|nr:methylmalonyl-CoA mutase [Chloroflexota bacterium]
MSNNDAYKKWQAEILEPALERFPERKDNYTTASGIPLPRAAVPPESEEYLQKLGFPGEQPYTRGVYPTMHRGRLWTMRQYAGYASAEESNQRYRYLLEQGQTGLSVAFDLPTQIGYDSDHPLAAGEVGRVGVPISSLPDMEALFRDIPLDKVSTSMTINAPAAILLAMYIAVAKKGGVDPKSLRGTIQNDILKEYVARGTYIFPPQPSMRLITDTFQYCQTEVPRWNTISISGYHIREAGSTAIQEVAFTLANGIAYVEAALNAGLNVDGFGRRLSFFFNAHNDFLEEIAKFRAARRLWASIMEQRFSASHPDALKLRFHTQTAGCTLTAQQPHNNVVRVALQALAAVLGGTQSLHTNSMDEALSLPTEEAVQVALRTQQILAEESGVANTIDPLGGSYLVESLTDEIESRAREYIAEIDRQGGALAAIENGYIQGEIQEAAYRQQLALETGDAHQVGVNIYAMEETIALDLLTVDPVQEKSQQERLARLRAERDGDRADKLQAKLKSTAEGDDNLMPLLIECVEAGLTLGEITDTLRGVWGEYRPPGWF